MTDDLLCRLRHHAGTAHVNETAAADEIEQLRLAQRVCRTIGDFDSEVYRWCHLAMGRCKNPHEDWLRDFEGTEADIAEAMKAPGEKGVNGGAHERSNA